VRRGGGEWNPHASYHLDGRLHHKSHNRKMIVTQHHPLTGEFRGTVHRGMFAGHFPKCVGAICDPAAFEGVMEIEPGMLGPSDGFIAVDLVEPGCEPMKLPETVKEE